MTLHLELTPEQEARITAAARQQGIGPEELALKLLEAHLPTLLSAEEKTRREQVMEELIAETERLGLYQ